VPLDLALDDPHLVEHPHGVTGDDGSELGQRRAASVAVRDAATDAPLERGEVVRRGRLAVVEARGCARERALLGDRLDERQVGDRELRSYRRDL
jgi:hypothetical protein